MKKKRPFLFFMIMLSVSFSGIGQENEDALYIKEIYNHTLTSAKCYDWLHVLSTDIGGRLAGSPQASAAVEYTRQIMEGMGLDKVWLQECEVPHWVRGQKETVRIVSSSVAGSKTLNALSLGNSTGTGKDGITAKVIEVQGLDEVEELGRENIEGNIVFFNRPMDPTQLNTFNAYGGAVDQRVFGPEKASKFGAVGALIRSMTTLLDDVPHTGTTAFRDGTPHIPAIAISTNDAELLSHALKGGEVSVYMENYSKMLTPVKSYNVIGEIRGSEFPDEIILVGGHLDSWDVGGGAHDDGAGCVHSLQVLQNLIDMGYQPKRTIRCVMFMNEENGLGGGKAYAEISNEKGEYHLAAIESDNGGFTPRGFTCDAETDVFNAHFPRITRWSNLLEPYGLYLQKGGSGADIGPLKSQRGLLFGFKPDTQRYFDFHHTEVDRIEAVNQRELELGAAAMTSLVYLIDKYGIK